MCVLAAAAAGWFCPQAARLHPRWVDVQGEVARTVSEYDALTSGPTKWSRLTAFLQQQYGHMVADFVQRCEAEADKKVCGWVGAAVTAARLLVLHPYGFHVCLTRNIHAAHSRRGVPVQGV